MSTYLKEPRPPYIHPIGPAARHDQACAVLWHSSHVESAVYNNNTRVFEPSWKAQRLGWRLLRFRSGWRLWLAKKLADNQWGQ